MICPHCLIGISEYWQDELESKLIDNVEDKKFQIASQICTECKKLIIKMTTDTLVTGQFRHWQQTGEKYLHPKKPNRKPIPTTVPKKFSKDYFEAVAVLSDSPNASSALSRRVLQHILEEISKVAKDRLGAQIKEARKKERFDPKLDGLLDYVRKFGNFGAHATKDYTDRIIDVEPGEAETMLEIIEALFDYYYLKPEELKKLKEQLDKKLQKKKGKN